MKAAAAAVVVGSFRFPMVYAFTETNLPKSSFIRRTEIADGSLFLSIGNLLPSHLSSKIYEGNRSPPQRNLVFRKLAKEDKDQNIFEASDGESSDSPNHDEIIALLKRIQSQISKGKTVGKKDDKISPMPDSRFARPATNVYTRSASINSSPTSGNGVNEVTRGEGPLDEVVGKELPTFENMKVPELKEYAKSKGVKGYSKLKKADLVELLKGL